MNLQPTTAAVFLFRPELLVQNGTPTPNHGLPGSTPLPLPRLGLSGTLWGAYRCTPLIRIINHSTTTTSVTNPAEEVELLSRTPGNRLTTIRKCDQLNERLFNYADFSPGASGIIPNAAQLPYYNLATGQNVQLPFPNGLKGLSTESGSPAFPPRPFPSGEVQYGAILSIYGFYLEQKHDGEAVPVESEAAIQSEHNRQIGRLVIHYLRVSTLTTHICTFRL